jgi:hypothetical protein
MQSKAQSSACTSAWTAAFAFCGIVRLDYARQSAQGGIFFLTVDEELSVLEDHMRRLKVEYDIYFGGGSKKPPADIEWKVKNLLRKYSDGGRMNFGQRFRFNTCQQRYALYNALWQQKLQIKEEGYRRPQDAMLGIQGLRDEAQHEAEIARRHHATNKEGNFVIACEDREAGGSQVEALFQSLSEARAKTGEKSSASLASFKKFVNQKTEQLRKEYGCKTVEYSVELQNGQVKLKAKPKT